MDSLSSWKYRFIEAPEGELIYQVIESQRRRWPSPDFEFEGRTIEEREQIITDWNLVQFGRYAIGKQNFVQKEGSFEERLLKEATVWRKFLFQVAPDRKSALQLIGTKITELPPEITLFRKVSHINARDHSIEFVPEEVGMMSLEYLDLSNNNLSIVPASLLRLNVNLRGNCISPAPEWSEGELRSRFYPQKKP